MADVKYPTVPDTTIGVGDRVRSFDFTNNSRCYFVGVVESLTDQNQYKIKVEYQIWNGIRSLDNYCDYVLPPMNGVQSQFNRSYCGVQRVLEGEEV